MKQIYFIAALGIFFITACKSEKKDTQEEQKRIFQIESVDENTGLQRMQVSRINQEITCKGKKYQLFIEREPDENLPHVKSDMGLFVDNHITVKILRENGTKLFEKQFVKKDFSTHLPEQYLSHSVLEGLVFDDVKTAEENKLILAASISYPMTDLYIPFSIIISEDGKMSLEKDEDMGEFTPLEEDSVENDD